jgi:hypothetical protein
VKREVDSDKGEERFHPAKGAGWRRGLTAQAGRFAGANAEEKASACSVRNDGGGRPGAN